MNPVSPNSSSRSDKGPPFLFGLIFFCAGLFFLSTLGKELARSFRPIFWPAVECRIASSCVEKAEEAGKYRFSATYVYLADGAERTGSAIDIAGESERVFDDVANRQRLLDHFAVGTTHRCQVNPNDPSDAVLRTAEVLRALGLSTLPALPVPFIFMLLGGGIVVSRVRCWFGSPAKKSPATHTSSSGSGQKLAEKIIPPLLGLIFGGVGYGFLIAYLSSALQVPDLATVTGEVLSSELKVVHGQRSTSYRPCIAYRYTVDGKTYESDCYDWPGFRFKWKDQSSSSRQIVKAHPIGSPIEVFYSQRDPKKCALTRPEPLGKMDLGICLFFSLFAFVGTLVIVHVLKEWRPRQILSGEVCTERKLKRKLDSESVARIIFCLTWNTFCVTIQLLVGGSGTPRWHPIRLFIVVFQLIGIVLLVKLIRRLVRIVRGAHYEVRVSTNALGPGELVQLTYALIGARTIERLVIRVVRYDPKKVAYGKSGYQAPVGQALTLAEKSGAEALSGSLVFRIPKPDIKSPQSYWRLVFAVTADGRTTEDQFALC